MDEGKLVFRGPADGSGKLVFGVVDDGGGGIAPVSVGLDADLGGLDGEIGVAIVTRASLDDDLGGLEGQIGMLWDGNVSRGLRHEAQAHWQKAKPLQHATRSRWQTSVPMLRAVCAPWQSAAPRQHAARQHWQDAERLRNALQSVYQIGAPLRNTSTQHWQDAERLRCALQVVYQDAAPLRHSTRQHWQENLRLRAALLAQWQQAAQLRHSNWVAWANGSPLHTAQRHHWQEAVRPSAGVHPRPQPPIKEPCYDPATLGVLIFDEAWTNDGKLVFVCYRKDGNPEPGGTVVVPTQRTYIVLNSIFLRRVRDNALIPAYSFSMSLDADSWTWSWQASLHSTGLAMIQPEDGQPVEVEVHINNVPYRLLVERFTRERTFANTRINVSGRGRAALLDSPFAPSLNHTNTSARSAQQLAQQVLAMNGAPIGWDLDWQLTDWQVPANAWALQGSFIAALADIAGAVGGYLQPHNTAQTMRVLPRYPVAPWLWSSMTPDYELPADVAAVEGVEWVQNADYNRVFVSGGGVGVLGQVTRAGTAGDSVAPLVTHALITDAEAARQRGIAELAPSGRQQIITLSLQVLTQTNVIVPGKSVRYVDGGTTKLGMVRSTSVGWEGGAKLRQSISLEVPEAVQ